MLKAAVIGVGYLGRFHAEKYYKADNAKLVALIDPNPENAAKLAKKYGAIYSSDYKVLPSLGVQCVSVVTNTPSHYEIASWLLEQGINVLLEKPVTTTSIDARKLVELSENKKLILQAGHLERFNPAFQSIKKLLVAPRFFEVRRISPFSGRSADVDVVFDLMIHDIDLVSHLVDRPLLKVDAVGTPILTPSYDIVNARLTFEGGAVANITASRAALKSERSMRVFQPDLYVSVDFEKKYAKIYHLTKEKKFFGLFPGVEVEELRVDITDALQEEVNSFLKCVENGEKPQATGVDGLRAVEYAERIRVAIDEHARLYA